MMPRVVSVIAVGLSMAALHCGAGTFVAVPGDGGSSSDGSSPADATTTKDGDILVPPAEPPPPPPPPGTAPKDHRPNAMSCASPRPAGYNTDAGAVDSGVPGFRCSSDAECTTGINGRCTSSRLGLTCTYDTCAKDSECTAGTNALCACRGQAGGTGNQCSQGGNCRLDADCAGGKGYCSPTYAVGCNLSFQGFYCHTPTDTCLNDDDCNMGGSSGGLCTYDPKVARWECSQIMCAG